MNKRVLISTVPFGKVDPAPLELLQQAGADYVFNPLGRRFKEQELIDHIGDFSVLIAGAEPITARVISSAPNLKLIARLGIGLDNVDLAAAHQRGIRVTYTPEVPAPAVAELTIGLMLALLRHIPRADRAIRAGTWPRYVGRRLAEQTVGVIGVGRIGRRVVQHLRGFGCSILAVDAVPNPAVDGARWVDKNTLLRESDIVTLHLPRTDETAQLITSREIAFMKPSAYLINTSRGELVNEHDLAAALRRGRLAGAALDVFAAEPYEGELIALDNVVLTSHLGSMTDDVRARMEIDAAREVARYLAGEPPLQPAPTPGLVS